MSILLIFRDETGPGLRWRDRRTTRGVEYNWLPGRSHGNHSFAGFGMSGRFAEVSRLEDNPLRWRMSASIILTTPCPRIFWRAGRSLYAILVSPAIAQFRPSDTLHGGPARVNSDRFDVIAKAPVGTPPDKIRLMLQRGFPRRIRNKR